MTQENSVPKKITARLRKRSAEWPVFQKNLAAALKSMQEDESLIISIKHSKRFVQFAALGGFGMRAETTSEAYLASTETDSTDNHLGLLALGWFSPTRQPAESAPEDDPDGSPNYFVDFPPGTSLECIAELSVHTLADLYEISHPGELEYDAFDHDGNPIEHTVLKIQCARDRKARFKDPAVQLRKAVSATTGIQDLEYDEDDCLCLRYRDNLSLFVMLPEGASYIHFMSILAEGITPNKALLALINELNDEPKPSRFLVHGDSVIAMYLLPAQPIINDHIAKVLSDFADQVLRAVPRVALLLRQTVGNSSVEAQTLH